MEKQGKLYSICAHLAELYSLEMDAMICSNFSPSPFNLSIAKTTMHGIGNDGRNEKSAYREADTISEGPLSAGELDS